MKESIDDFSTEKEIVNNKHNSIINKETNK